MKYTAKNLTTGAETTGTTFSSALNKMQKLIGAYGQRWHRDNGLTQNHDDQILEYGQFSNNDNRIRISNY